MLAALAAVRDRAVHGTAFELHCIHIEHGIRPADESRGDAAFVRSLCEKFNVPCRVVSIAPGKIATAAKDRNMGIEAAARHYRHRAWSREAARCALRVEAKRPEVARPETAVRVLTAHTADDMLETVLMRLLRGAGPTGLAAMPVSRGRILRPLIALSRRDVLNYLSEKNISWREDSTNTDIRFLRNRVRRCLIPLLEESFPQWRVGVAALAETQSLVADFIQSEAALRVCWETSPLSLYTDVTTFFAQPPIIREEALFQGIDQLLPASSHTIKRKNIRRFCAGGITAIDLGPLRLKKDSHRITISIFSDPRSRIRSFDG
jgi:tRNA(Ile)-lysidine synthase